MFMKVCMKTRSHSKRDKEGKWMTKNKPVRPSEQIIIMISLINDDTIKELRTIPYGALSVCRDHLGAFT